jgi:Chaperone of endosialidase
MNPLIQFKTKTSPITNSMNRSSLWRGFVLIAITLACFALSPQARAVCQEGCLTNENTVLGEDALLNTTGSGNTAIGFNALFSNPAGGNTAVGAQALFSNNSVENTAVGEQALFSNTSGQGNVAIGNAALFSNTFGFNNTATGEVALNQNTTGTQNTATGVSALLSNRIANNNTADGFQALLNNTGGSNTAIGSKALLRNSTGSSNIGLGASAGTLLTTGSNNIAIGNFGVAAESDTIRIGQVQTRAFIKGISGVAIAGAAVVVNASGQLGVVASSADFKHEIRPMGEESEAILALKPVSFCYDQDIDEQSLPQYGLVAEDVEKVNPDLVLRNEEGKPYSVRYEAVNAMLLNEFLKEHRKNEEQQATIAQLKSGMEALTATVKEQAAQIQRVSAQLEASRSAPQVTDSNY